MALPLPPLSFTGGATGPSRADSSGNYSQSVFDSSGWTVSTGSSKASAATGLGASAGTAVPWVLLAIGGVVAFYLWKKR